MNAVGYQRNQIRGEEPESANPARLLHRRAAEHPDRTFVSVPDRECSYAQVYARAVSFAKGLIAVGLRLGGHVAVLMPNRPTFLELMFAVRLAGGVFVPGAPSAANSSLASQFW